MSRDRIPLLSDFVLAINQPNNVTFPELLVSALVNERMHSHDGNWGGHFVYNWPDSHELTRVDGEVLRLTYPKSESDFQKWTESIKTVFEVKGNLYEDLARALADELQGVKATNSPRISAIPVTPSSALLQSYTGVLGSAQAERFDLVLNQIFLAGSGPGYMGPTAGELLTGALRRRMERDGFLGGIERIVRTGILPKIDPHIDAIAGAPVAEIGEFRVPDFPEWVMGATPFAWFKRSWELLTSDEWSDVLPARRWVDWLSTVARLAIGFSELWQARVLENLGELILSDETDVSLESVLRSINQDPLINWQDRYLASRSRNVQIEIRTLVMRGALVRKFIETQFKNKRFSRNDDLAKVLSVLRTTADREALNEILANKRALNAGKARRDAVESCLTARSTSGEYTDHYGFLVKMGSQKSTYRVVDPSTEVIAIVASLACGYPGGMCTVGDLRRELGELGLRPSIPELVSRLVGAGLSTRLADASDAVEIHSAF